MLNFYYVENWDYCVHFIQYMYQSIPISIVWNTCQKKYEIIFLQRIIQTLSHPAMQRRRV